MILLFKRSFIVASIALGVAFFSPVKAQQKTEITSASDSLTGIASLVQFAKKHLHMPYRSGGASKKGFDCSGFVRYCFNKWDVTLPHSSEAQAKHGTKITLPEAQPGDLIFFKGQSASAARIGHVGIITEVTPSYVKFIHSAWNGGIRYDLLSASYYQKRFVAIRRLID